MAPMMQILYCWAIKNKFSKKIFRNLRNYIRDSLKTRKIVVRNIEIIHEKALEDYKWFLRKENVFKSTKYYAFETTIYKNITAGVCMQSQ